MIDEPKAHGAVALRYRDFRLLWAGSFFSQVGSQMFVVGIGWLAAHFRYGAAACFV